MADVNYGKDRPSTTPIAKRQVRELTDYNILIYTEGKGKPNKQEILSALDRIEQPGGSQPKNIRGTSRYEVRRVPTK